MTQIGEGVAVAIPKPSDPTKSPDPTLTARWSRPDVTPDHNAEWPLSDPPENPDPASKPERAIVRLIAATTDVPDGTKAEITIHRCDNDAVVEDHDKVLEGLEVRAGVVVSSKTKKPPEFIFTAKHFDCKAEKTPWDPWDTPFFYFKVEVDHQGLEAQTSKDFKGEAGKVLRVGYWHACLSDWFADNEHDPTCGECEEEYPGETHCPEHGWELYTGLSTQAEMREIGALLRQPNHHVYERAFDETFVRNSIPANAWGSAIRNCFVYHQASHGNIDTIFFGRTAFGPSSVKKTADVPSVPRYLVYLNICLAGKKSNLADAFIGRGTQNVLAFRVSIPDGDARELAQRFYKRWARSYGCDPGKIAPTFWEVAPFFWWTMEPVLYGPGGGKVRVWHRLGKAIEGLATSISDLFK